jgi:hypothetical protein
MYDISIDRLWKMTIYYLFSREDKKEKLYKEYQKKIETVTQVERYAPYTAVYGYFTDRITAVISGTEIRPYHYESTVRIRLYIVPYYCAQDYEKIRSVYGAVWSKFSVKIRIAVSIDLGNHYNKDAYNKYSTASVDMGKRQFNSLLWNYFIEINFVLALTIVTTPKEEIG